MSYTKNKCGLFIMLTFIVNLSIFIIVFNNNKSHDNKTSKLKEIFISYADNSTPSPLILDLHGYSSTSYQQKITSGIDQIAKERHWNVLWPLGFKNSWNCGNGIYPPASSENIKHTNLLLNRINNIKSEKDISGVIISGYSNGCCMVHKLLEVAPPFTFDAAICASHYRPKELKIPEFPTPILIMSGEKDTAVSTDKQIANTLSALVIQNNCDGTYLNNETDEAIISRYKGCEKPLINMRLKNKGHSIYGPATINMQKEFLADIFPNH